MDAAEEMRQALHQGGHQGLQLVAGLHQLLHARHHPSVAGEHFALGRHHVRDERVTPALLLKDNTGILNHGDALD